MTATPLLDRLVARSGDDRWARALVDLEHVRAVQEQRAEWAFQPRWLRRLPARDETGRLRS